MEGGGQKTTYVGNRVKGFIVPWGKTLQWPHRIGSILEETERRKQAMTIRSSYNTKIRTCLLSMKFS